MNFEDTDRYGRILTDRVEWAKGVDVDADGALTRGNDALLLDAGDRLSPTGWVHREIAGTPGRATLTGRGLLAAMRAHWFPEWDRLCAEWGRERPGRERTAQEALAEVEAERLAALAKSKYDREQALLEAQRQADQKRWASELEDEWQENGPAYKYRSFGKGDFDVSTPERADALGKALEFPYPYPRLKGDDDPHQFNNLVLLGTPGTGKTVLAALWLGEFWREIEHSNYGLARGIRFITATQLAREAHNMATEQAVLNRFAAVGGLVIDDVGAITTEAAIRQLIDLLDMRLADGRETCITSNATPAQLHGIFGPRGYSRIFANAQVVRLNGRDYRMVGET